MATISIIRERNVWSVRTSILPLDATEPEETTFDSGDIVVDWFHSVALITEAFRKQRIADLRTTFVTTGMDNLHPQHQWHRRKAYIIPTDKGWEMVDGKPNDGTFFPLYLPDRRSWNYQSLCSYVTIKTKASIPPVRTP